MISLVASRSAATLDRDGYSAALVNPRFIKPLDREMLERYARRVAAFVTFEDHVKMGGFGTAVSKHSMRWVLQYPWSASAGPTNLSRRQNRPTARQVRTHR